MKVHYTYIFALFNLLISCSLKEELRDYTTSQVIQTSRAGDKLSEKDNLTFSNVNNPDIPVITLNPQITFQKILGIGGSFTESSAYILNQLSAEKRNEVISAYFSPDGAAYSLTRTHINSCDFSVSKYSYADIAGDTELNNFTIAEDMSDLIPLIKDAQKVKGSDFKIISSPWTAPPWMKDNNDWFGGSLKPEYYATWALFFSKYIKAYAEQGIDIWGVTVENEPLGNNASWESMHYTPESMSDFVKNYLGPQFEIDKIKTKILVYDQNRDHLQEWATRILSDPETAKYIWGTAVHWYSSTTEWYPEALNEVHNLFPDKHLLHTEGCIDSEVPVWQDDDWYWQKEATDWGYIWTTGEEKKLHPKYSPVYRYARDIIGGLNSWLEGWIDWNIVLNTQGGPNHVKNWCIAPVIAKPETDEVYYTPMYYILSHFSKYIRPGAHRIRVNSEIENLMVTACLNPDKTIAVEILNQNAENISFQISLNRKYIKSEIPGNALQTLILN
jgi:glucosylceramidase